MALIHETLSAQFYEWEMRGRGWKVWPQPVSPEPAFRPFWYTFPSGPAEDDGHRPTFLSSFFGRLTKGNDPAPNIPFSEPVEEPEPEELVRDSLVELQTSLPAKLDITAEAFGQFLRNLALCREPIAFELVGGIEGVKAQFAARPEDARLVRRQLEAHFPDASFLPGEGALEAAWDSSKNDEILVVEFGLDREFMFPLQTGKLDAFVGIVGALSELGEDEVAAFQVLFQSVRGNWAPSIVRSVTDSEGKPFFVNMPELAEAGENKVKSSLYAAVVRIGVKAETYERAVSIARDLAGSLTVFDNPSGNRLIPLSNEEYPFNEHVEDLLRRQSRRTGMLLSADELIGFVHIPGSAVRSPSFERESGKTKMAPTIAQGERGLLLGNNVHLRQSTPVSLTLEQRSRHIHIIGSSGTGKSTLLFNLISQAIEDGEGLAVLDPHGDLVDEILGIVPVSRTNDVVLIDPSDEAYSVGFNILSAHSDLEKNLLSSDLVSVFQRLSTSWGDQMGIVLQNAILAFLESSRGGTLADMRRFLIEPGFRDEFLCTVSDPDIVYYWRKAFKELTGNRSIGPVITRLETFLAPKPLRYMVAQEENRIDFADIMDSGKIFLAKLPQGQIGKENSFLLGSLLVSKFQQLAMSRQSQRIESRRFFTLVIDEFQNFITPSMAEILSGARKYRLGLILAHQELRQLERDREVASAVLSNPYTRIVFRVGDADARALESGFSFFEARDLQNLEIGQAICRIEKADGDFNLSIPFPERRDQSDADERRRAAISASRAQYATPRSAIEEALRAKFAKSDAEEAPPKRKSAPPAADKGQSPPVPSEPPKTTGSEEKNPLVQQPKEPEKSAPPDISPIAPSKTAAPETTPSQIANPEIPSVPPATAEPKQPASDKGIGGNQHNLIRERIELAGRELGYTTSRENPTGNGGKIDVVLEKSSRAIACEIAITTTIDHEVGNVAKCLQAGFKYVAVISPTVDRLEKIKTAVTACVSADEARRVAYYQPDQFIAYLHGLKAEDSSPTVASPSESKFGKYKVKRAAATLTTEELKEREAAALAILAEAMRKKK